MSIKPRNKLKPIFFFLLFSFFSALLIFSDEGASYNFLILFLSFTVCEISLFQIFIKNHFKYSLHQIFHLFFLFFFGIAPALQFKNDAQFWGATYKLTTDDYLFGNVFILFCLFFFNLFHDFLLKNWQKKKYSLVSRNKNLILNNYKLIFISFVALVVFLYSKSFDLSTIFLRSNFNSKSANAISNGSLSLIINNFVRPIPAVVLFSYKFFQKNNKFSVVEFILIFLTLICDFPLGMPRFLAATLYIPLVLIYFSSLRKPFNFALIFCMGILIVFPFLDQFRFATEFSAASAPKGVSTKMFSEGTFDAYQNTINVITKNEITYGSQLLGVLFFYVPRVIWSNKPLGSGAYISDRFNYDFSNISMSFVGEGYLNFGFFGVFLYLFLFAFLVSKFDYLYWNNFLNKEYMIVIYYFLFGLLFFNMRGDMLSSFAYTLGLSSGVYVVFKICTK
jgi:oligosaccharide repeat unit polymerase